MERANLNSHSCGFCKCKNCNKKVNEDHKCFITRLQSEKKLSEPTILFDCESTKELNYHQINFIISRRMCKECIKNFSTIPFQLRRERIQERERLLRIPFYAEEQEQGLPVTLREGIWHTVCCQVFIRKQ